MKPHLPHSWHAHHATTPRLRWRHYLALAVVLALLGALFLVWPR